MSENLRPIVMRSNRLLGAALVERNLISVDQLNEATERFLQVLDTGGESDASLLSVLVHETKAISEEALLEYLIDELQLGLIDVRDIDFNDDVKLKLKPDVCRATWSVPFDQDEDINYIASAYCLSPAVRQYWEKQLGGQIIWYGCTMESLNDFLDKLELERAAHAGVPEHAGAA
jgi:hypothetical protein